MGFMARRLARLARPYVFFDLGETIVNLGDTVPVLASILAYRFPSITLDAAGTAKHWFIELAEGVPRDPGASFETQYEVGRRILAGLLRERGLRVHPNQAGDLLREAWGTWQQKARLCEGVTKEWLTEVRRLSEAVGAVTDGDEADVHGLLEKMGLLRYFDSVTTSEASRAYKPNPVVYQQALDSLSAEPGRSLFVSDSILDLHGAHAVGMHSVWFRRNQTESAMGLPPRAVSVSHPRELNKVLSRFRETGKVG